jgi:hypothetical protein
MGHKVLSVPSPSGTSGESLGPHSRPDDGTQPWSSWDLTCLRVAPAGLESCFLAPGRAARPGADAHLGHLLAWLEKETGTARPTISTVVFGRGENGTEPAA